MSSVALGPLVFDAARLAAILGCAVLLGGAELADIRARRRGAPARHAVQAMRLVVTGLIAARAGYVAQNLAVFAEAPLDVLKVWQGGFSVGFGLAGLGAALAVTALRDRRSALPLGGLALGAVALGFGLLAAFPDPRGRPAPDVPLHALGGAPLTLTALDGPAVVNLWASWCPPCRREMPMMMEVAAGGDLPILFVNQGEQPPQITRFLEQAGLARDGIYLDPVRALMTTYGARGLPATLFLDAEGRLVDTHTGEISRAELLRRMTTLSKGTT